MASIISGFEYDIFISYRQKDNKYDNWVTEFVENLKRELEATFKDEISVYFDINPHDGLLETYDVDATLKDKLKCLVCIPIISRTYCDPKSFAWEHEFKPFVEQASNDQFGLKIKLPNGNYSSRVLPVRIHDLDSSDVKLFESIVGNVLRPIDFIYKETGVNRQLRAKDDDIIKSPNQILYRDQINKVALALKNIIESMKIPEAEIHAIEKEILIDEPTSKTDLKTDKPIREEEIISEQQAATDKIKQGKEIRPLNFKKPGILVPGLMFILFILIALFLILNHHSKVKWAKEKAIPEIYQLATEEKYIAVFKLVNKAEKYISKEPAFIELSKYIPKLTIVSDPLGADVYIREYSAINGEWEKVGITPIDSMKLPPQTYYLVRMEKKGYENVLALAFSSQDKLERKLFKEGTIPPGMVYVDGYFTWGAWDVTKEDNGFFLDRYEVTNKQYKEFIDNGGYKNSKYWGNDFIKNGKSLTWNEAMVEFTDKTGRPGPATWEAGDYPDGQDDYPVGGVSWYEAKAYAEYAGKSLPTLDHWCSAAWANVYWLFNFCSRIAPVSNFRGLGPEPVGKNQGVNCFGAFDMAGNVREWCWNETMSGRVICGGAWNNVSYMYSQWSQLSPFDRSPENGFRCVKYIEKEKIPEIAFRKVRMNYDRDFLKEKPVTAEVFKIYKNQFLYDKAKLDPKIENRVESNADWNIEKITFNAAYGPERVIAYLYLPKNSTPPYQTLIYFPGTDAVTVKDLVTYQSTNWNIDFVLKNGRAVLYPVYKGTFERNDGLVPEMTEPNPSHQYTDWLIKWVKDFSRSIDYLETRSDIDKDKIGYFGTSWGGMMGGIIPAIEERLKLSIQYVGGFDLIGGSSFPEVDAINYVTRIKIPVLMLNGKYDPFFPYETTVIPFFNLLGTPEKDKRHFVYETDHNVPKSEMVKETLNWLDHYLGPVEVKNK